MSDQELQYEELAKPIIIKGFKEGATEDEIKGAMFDPNGKAKIPFGFLNKIFKKVAIEEGLIVDPAVAKAELEKQVSETMWDSIEDYEDFESVCQEIASEINGMTLQKVINAATSWCVENEIKVPAKPKAKKKQARARGGKAVRAIVDTFVANKTATKADVYAAIRPHVKAHKNAIDNLKMFYLMSYACANGMTMDEAFAATKDESYPVETE